MSFLVFIGNVCLLMSLCVAVRRGPQLAVGSWLHSTMLCQGVYGQLSLEGHFLCDCDIWMTWPWPDQSILLTGCVYYLIMPQVHIFMPIQIYAYLSTCFPPTHTHAHTHTPHMTHTSTQICTNAHTPTHTHIHAQINSDTDTVCTHIQKN